MNLTTEQYVALITLARKGVSIEQAHTLESFLKQIDKENNITRHTLLVQWQERDSPVPPGSRFPDKWPPELRTLLERLDRPISKADVVTAVHKASNNPHTILVTRDALGIVGWTSLDLFFVT